MFALVAAIILFLAAFNVHVGSVNLLILGLAFWALHFVWNWAPWTLPNRNP